MESFLGFANFYRRFIKGYSNIVTPMTHLTRKNTHFLWSDEYSQSFETLKQAFTTAPILRHFDYDHEIIVETDASNYISAGILSQYDDEGLLHPIDFFSKKHTPAECNYDIYDKELMAIVRAFEEWRPELEGALHPIHVLSDHKNLEYFMSTKLLNRRQTRWAEYLSRFNFKIVYRPGKAGGKPDALTRRSGDLPQGGDERLTEQQKAVLKPQNLPDNPPHLSANGLSEQQEAAPKPQHVPPNTPRTTDLHLLAEAPTSDGQSSLLHNIEKATRSDPFAQRIISLLHDGKLHSKEISLSECDVRDGRLYYQQQLYIPNDDNLQLQLLQSHHDAAAAGYPGRAKTFDLLRRRYYWPTLRRDMERYVANCHTCKRTKSSRHLPYGVLHPLPAPERPWKDIALDLVTGLPNSRGHDAIWVVVDRLTKMRHLVPCSTMIDAEGLANLFMTHIFRLHGLSDTIVSDRGPQFASRFWKHLCYSLKIEPRLSMAFHPEMDG
jgi:hypothetical protein